MYGIYAPYLDNMINCRISTEWWGEAMYINIRGLNSSGELIECYRGAVHIFSFGSVKTDFLKTLAEPNEHWAPETMTDEEVVDAFITGVVFECRSGQHRHFAAVWYNITSGPKINLGTYWAAGGRRNGQLLDDDWVVVERT